jgi:ABC-2 type transport system permease protein
MTEMRYRPAHTLRALPTMLRVGMAETLAYRVEFVIWMMTNSLPLIMLGLWTSVASEAPFGRFREGDFIAYYLAALIVRNLTGSWVVWQLNDEIRTGRLSARLLRPVHPFVQYASTHAASVPLRALVAVPFAAAMLFTTARGALATEPALYAIFFASVAGAWMMAFFTMMIIGSLGLFIEKSVAVYEVYLGVFAMTSGYLVPLELLPGWAQSIAASLPFRYMIAFPVETLTGVNDVAVALRELATQWAWVAVIVLGAYAVWRAGVRRYEAYGS